MNDFDVIIAAAGSGTRSGTDKLRFVMPNGKNVLQNSVLPFLGFNSVKKIIIATRPEERQKVNGLFSAYGNRVVTVDGGASRTASVKNALSQVTSEFVLIHDGARPYVSAELINRVMRITERYLSAVPTIPPSDSLCSADGTPLDRNQYLCTQTPQGFNSIRLKTAYNSVTGDFSDDAKVYYSVFGAYHIVEGETRNKKITYPSDLSGRSGIGYDIHRLINGNKLVLGGIEIPFEKGLDGHSDADVVIHAIMDSILTALGRRDIGHYFPIDDDRYQNISSSKLLKEVVGYMETDGFSLENVSVSIIAEKPKLADYISKIKDKLSIILGLPSYRIGIAVTTNEGVGVLGSTEAIAAFATVLLSVTAK